MNIDSRDPEVANVATLCMIIYLNNLKDDQRISFALLVSTFLIKFYAKKNNIDNIEAYNQFIRELGKLMNDSPEVKLHT